MALAVLWGTWEELVLGGAVLRHGTSDWIAVSVELSSRTAFPHLFTPQVCATKYNDLQERYSGCDAWFEELRKKRVAELKRALEKSEDSIGSLQSKLESLTSEKESDGNSFEYDTSRTQSISPADDADDVDYFCKEASRDGSSAGSFTKNTCREGTPECEIPASISVQDNDLKMRLSEDFMMENAVNLCRKFGYGTFRKKRGQRKRKTCNIVKEASVGENDMISSSVKMDSEEPSEGCQLNILTSSEKFCRAVPRDEPFLDLAGIFDSISKDKDVSIFRYKLENQKRAKYKKIIRRHVDLQSISSGIINGSISSATELFRDLLLLCNNVLVYYRRNSSEHKSALAFRDIVVKHLQQQTLNTAISRPHNHGGTELHVQATKPKKIGSVRHCDHMVRNAASVAGNGDESGATETSNKERAAVGSPVRKRGIGRPPKGCQRGGRMSQLESSMSKESKKTRR